MANKKTIALAALDKLSKPDGMRPIWLEELKGDVLYYINALEKERDQFRGMLWSGNYNDKQRMAEHDAKVIDREIEWLHTNYPHLDGPHLGLLQSRVNQLRQKAQDSESFPRADPKELARFDPSTKKCTMNCGPHSDDPRSREERKFLCTDCENVLSKPLLATT